MQKPAMNSFKYTISVLAVSLLVLTGCNKPEEPTTKTTATANPSATQVTTSPAASASAEPETKTETKTETKPETTTETKTETTTETKPETDTKATSGNADKGFGDLTAVVSKTQQAVDANDFAKAGKEFDKFEDSWSKVEDGVKAKSKDTYNTIEDNADKLKDALKASDKKKSTEALQALNTSITSVSKP